MTKKELLEELGGRYDITECQICGKEIVVREVEMDYPMCNSVDCIEEFVKNST